MTDPADDRGFGESLGDYLRLQREVREITLEDVQRHSRIRMDHLRSLESDRFELLPASVFVRNYIRVYAECVGLDEAEALARYEVAQRRYEARVRRRVRAGSLAQTALRTAGVICAGTAFAVLLGWTGFFGTFAGPETPAAARPPSKKERILALKRELGLLGSPAEARQGGGAAPFCEDLDMTPVDASRAS